MNDVEVGPIALAQGDGEAVWFTTNRVTLKATAPVTGGAFGLWEAIAPAGSSPPLHVHRREDESFWVLEGVLTIRCGEETFSAGPGSFAFLPRGIPHTFVVEGETPARFVGLCTPGGFERYFTAAGAPAGHDGLPPQGPPDIALLNKAGEQFDVEIVGPPLHTGNA